MKNVFKFSFLIMIFMSLLSSTCSSDDDGISNSNNNSAEIQVIETAVESGNWVITLYNDSGQVETSNYNGYVFTFGNNGALTATNSTNTYTGTWSITDSSNSSSSSSSDDIDFNISFASPPNFEELSDDWDIVSHTSTKIELTDVSGGNGGTDFLTFEKQ